MKWDPRFRGDIRMLFPALSRIIIGPFLEERARWLLWLPVFMGFGIAFYFALPFEPVLWPALAATAAALLAALALRNSFLLPLLVALLVAALGFTVVKLEADAFRQPMLREILSARMIKGRVTGITHLPKGYRLMLSGVRIADYPAEKTPLRMRVKFTHSTKLPRPGAWIDAKAILYPLSGPIEPGAFNFRRYAYFQGYGATGFALGYWHYAKGPPPSFWERVGIFFEKIRLHIARTFREYDESRETAVAVALVTGDQAGIGKGTLAAMRISGISHILSVSGLHIAMVAGIVFFTLRALMALWPWLALHAPIKKIAAGAAIAVAVFYTLICGAPVPAVRSMLMAGIVLLAVMVDRRAASMRLVALAAFFCLLFAPASLLDVSFQLSFAAVAALIAAYERREHDVLARFRSAGLAAKTGLYVAGSALTSLVASAATAPFILYYFQQVNWYGVITNLIAVPLSTFIIMPAGVLAVLATPFGLEEGPLYVMRGGITLMLESAEWVALLPGSVTYHPAAGFCFLLASGFGLLWLCIWQKRWRFLGLVPLAVGTLGFLFTPRPDVLIADDAVTVAVRAQDGNRIVRAKSMDEFDVDIWRARDGMQGVDAPAALNWFDIAEKGGQGALSCEGNDCIYALAGKRIAFPMTWAGLQAACREADIIVGAAPDEACPGKTIINKKTAEEKGSFAISADGSSVDITAARPNGLRRPWE